MLPRVVTIKSTANHCGVEGTPRDRDGLLNTRLVEFLDELPLYVTIYEKLETQRRRDLRFQLLGLGKQVSSGTRNWVRQDLDYIALWRGMRPCRLMVDSVTFEDSLKCALGIDDERSKVRALCNIRGIGPALASTLLSFTWPENFGFVDHRTWNASRYLRGEFARKYYASVFTIAQLLGYFEVLRNLGEMRSVSSMEIAKALYALDDVKTRDNWREAQFCIERTVSLGRS